MNVEKSETRQHVLSVLLENEFGVLSKVAGLFASRGFNIESLTVGVTHDPSVSRMTVVIRGTSRDVDQVIKQLNKLIEVVSIQDLTATGGFIARELMIVKVSADEKNRLDILKIGELFKAKPIDFTPESLTFELVGSVEKINNFLTFLEPFGIRELARSGAVGINRGDLGLQTRFTQEEEARRKSALMTG